ncbi:hypothetical protein SLEP1_g22329 [Rubroshorea leprosula]|uniref:Uncharacterized protein n=1 Tax=Rubroshorea leprosula TaxID=152421 RepID=A0AAV5JEY2_9ROSI|nr:hypothetical protein SLEP1_g22329 [Rubroshorea leprosula]
MENWNGSQDFVMPVELWIYKSSGQEMIVPYQNVSCGEIVKKRSPSCGKYKQAIYNQLVELMKTGFIGGDGGYIQTGYIQQDSEFVEQNLILDSCVVDGSGFDRGRPRSGFDRGRPRSGFDRGRPRSGFAKVKRKGLPVTKKKAQALGLSLGFLEQRFDKIASSERTFDDEEEGTSSGSFFGFSRTMIRQNSIIGKDF